MLYLYVNRTKPLKMNNLIKNSLFSKVREAHNHNYYMDAKEK